MLLLAAMSGAAAAEVPRNGSSPAPDKPPAEPQLVTPEEEAEREASSFLAIFVCLVLLVTGTLATYALRRAKVPVPESWVYVALGSLLSTIIYSGASEQLKLIRETLHDSFSVIFFAALLPVIIFESGYSMHKVCQHARLQQSMAHFSYHAEKFLHAFWFNLHICIPWDSLVGTCRECVHVDVWHAWDGVW